MLNKVLLTVSLLAVSLCVAVACTPLTITSTPAITGLLCAALVAGITYWVRRFRHWSTLQLTVTNELLVTVVAVASFFHWGGDWKTRTVLYQHRYASNRTITFQMQDVGAWGYNKRTVDQIELLPGINWINHEYPNNPFAPEYGHLDRVEWQLVDRERNELGIHYN